MDFETYIDGAIKKMNSLGYKPTYFMQMRNDYGAIQAIKRLIHDPRPQGGFLKLHELGHPELTMESIVLEEQWHDLFTEEDRKAARNKLRK